MILIARKPQRRGMKRLRVVRDHLTDFYFAYNLPYEDFEEIVRQAIKEHGETPDLITV